MNHITQYTTYDMQVRTISTLNDKDVLLWLPKNVIVHNLQLNLEFNVATTKSQTHKKQWPARAYNFQHWYPFWENSQLLESSEKKWGFSFCRYTYDHTERSPSLCWTEKISIMDDAEDPYDDEANVMGENLHVRNANT